MIPVHQESNDDCFRAALASLMELSLDQVPQFVHDSWAFQRTRVDLRKWLRLHGYGYMEFCYGDNPMKWMAADCRDVYYILIIGDDQKPKENHAVVCLDDKMVHDPAGRRSPRRRARDGLLSAGANGVNHPANETEPKRGRWWHFYVALLALAAVLAVSTVAQDRGAEMQEAEHGGQVGNRVDGRDLEPDHGLHQD